MRTAALLLALLVPVSGCVSSDAEPAPIVPVEPLVEEEPWIPAWADLDEATIRPGSAARGCTFDWLFVDPLAHKYYVGIAAHCTDGNDTEDGTGTRIRSAGQAESDAWGTVVFDSDNKTLQGDFKVEDRVDFALVLLDDGVNLKAHPQSVGFAAPTGFVACDEVKVGDQIAWHGYGMGFGMTPATRPRTGVVGTCDGKDYGAYTAAIWGDSGSAVIHLPTNKALGIVSRLGIATSPPTELTGATIPYILTELAKHPDFTNIHLATIDGGFVGLQG
jgi:hypothetical protein